MGLLQQAPDALRADFRAFYGLRLRQAMEDDLMEAADLAGNIPPDKNSAVFRKLNPDAWRWGGAEHLAAHQVDLLRWLQWSKTRDASKKPPRNLPKPIPRPGITDKQTEVQGRFKDVEAMPLAELKRQLALPRRAITR